jgi:hypothetical protein
MYNVIPLETAGLVTLVSVVLTYSNRKWYTTHVHVGPPENDVGRVLHYCVHYLR